MRLVISRVGRDDLPSRSVKVTEGIHVGSSDCELQITDDPAVEDLHLLIAPDHENPQAIVVIPFSPAEINDVPITDGACAWRARHGDVIRIGDTLLEVRSESHPFVVTRDFIRPHWGAERAATNPPAPERRPAPAPVHNPRLSDDDTEHRLLAALRARPTDDETRAVYADWLEQRNLVAMARFVRDEDLELAELTRTSTATWRAITSRAVIVRCMGDHWRKPRCPRQWHKLAATPDERVRTCTTCQRPVRFLTRDDPETERTCDGRGEAWVIDIPEPIRR